jgi:hypothetical protein
MNRQWFSCALLSALCALAPGCTSQPKPPMTPPVWTAVPSAVVDAFCGKLRGEAMASDATQAIVKTTQPLVSGASLRSLAHLYNKDAELSVPAQLISASLQSLPLDFTNARTCTWMPIDKIDPVRHVDLMAVELSSPFVNPFARNEAGLFARLSLGGRESQWYWIPLAQRNGLWTIGNVFALDMHE